MNRKTIVLLLLIILSSAPAQLDAQTRSAQPRKTTPDSPPNPSPLTVAQVIEGLYSLGSVSKVEELVTKRGVNFQANPFVVEILKEFGATDKLLKLIPVPPVAPTAKLAGPLTVVCEPTDCLVVVNDRFYGSTRQGRAVVTGLRPGEVVVQAFGEGYDAQTRKLQLLEEKPLETKLVLQSTLGVRQQMAKETLLETIRSIGGIDGLSFISEFGGDGRLEWVDAKGGSQQWTMTFTKRPGSDMTMLFKTRDGQCSVTILNEVSKKECKGKLKNSGEDLADQAATFFLRFQVANVLQQLLDRIPSLSAAADGRHLDSVAASDSYALTLENDRLPSELVYSKSDKTDAPVRVKYANYQTLGKGRYPAQMEIAEANQTSGWVFTLTGIQTRVVRR